MTQLNRDKDRSTVNLHNLVQSQNSVLSRQRRLRHSLRLRPFEAHALDRFCWAKSHFGFLNLVPALSRLRPTLVNRPFDPVAGPCDSDVFEHAADGTRLARSTDATAVRRIAKSDQSVPAMQDRPRVHSPKIGGSRNETLNHTLDRIRRSHKPHSRRERAGGRPDPNGTATRCAVLHGALCARCPSDIPGQWYGY